MLNSLTDTCRICFYDFVHNLRIYTFRLTWTCQSSRFLQPCSNSCCHFDLLFTESSVSNPKDMSSWQKVQPVNEAGIWGQMILNAFSPCLWLANFYTECQLLSGKFINRKDDPTYRFYQRQSKKAEQNFFYHLVTLLWSKAPSPFVQQMFLVVFRILWPSLNLKCISSWIRLCYTFICPPYKSHLVWSNV